MPSDNTLLQAALSHLELALANVSEQTRCHEVESDHESAILAAASTLQCLVERPELSEITLCDKEFSVGTEANGEDLFEKIESKKPSLEKLPSRKFDEIQDAEKGPESYEHLNGTISPLDVLDIPMPRGMGILTEEEEIPEPESPHYRDPQKDLLKVMMDAFDELDKGHDLAISQSRLKVMVVHLGFHTHHINSVFNAIERTHDGLIFDEEWQSIAKQLINLHSSHEIDELVKRARGRRTGAVGHTATMYVKESLSRHLVPYRLVMSYKSKKRVAWDMFLLMLLLYVVLTLPLTFAFQIEAIMKIDQVVDWIFVCDVILNFRTSFLSRQREETFEPGAIAKRYLKSWFVLDVVSSVPLEQITDGMFPRLQPAKLLKFGKIAKVCKILRISKMFKMWAGSEIMDQWEEIVWSNHLHAISKFIQLLVQLLVVGHWLACLLIACGGDSILDYFNGDEAAHDMQKYLLAMYWAIMTMTTVGYGDVSMKTDYERMYAIVAMIIGGYFYGYVIGVVNRILSERDMNQRAFAERMEIVVGWLNNHYELPYILRRRIWRHFKEFLTTKKAIEDSVILNDLPPQMRADVSMFLLKDTVRCNPLFEGVSVAALSKLVGAMGEVKFQADEIVVNEGDGGKSMFIVNRGFVHLKMTDNHTRQLCAGDSFGEEVLLAEKKVYEYSVRTHSRVSMFRILRDEFISYLYELPQDLMTITDNYKRISQENRYREYSRFQSRSNPVAAVRANVQHASAGASSLIAGGASGIPPSFSDAVMDRFTDLMKKMDHIQTMYVDLEDSFKKKKAKEATSTQTLGKSATFVDVL